MDVTNFDTDFTDQEVPRESLGTLMDAKGPGHPASAASTKTARTPGGKKGGRPSAGKTQLKPDSLTASNDGGATEQWPNFSFAHMAAPAGRNRPTSTFAATSNLNAILGAQTGGREVEPARVAEEADA